jgi:hypothetical protein
MDVKFVTLFFPAKAESPMITARMDLEGIITVHGPGWVDTVSLSDVIHYHRAATSSEQTPR